MKKYTLAFIICSLLILSLFTLFKKESPAEQQALTSDTKKVDVIEKSSPSKVLDIDLNKTKNPDDAKLIEENNQPEPSATKEVKKNNPVKRGNSSSLKNRFQSEEVDHEWAHSHQEKIYTFYYDYVTKNPNLYLDKVVCKQTLCQVNISASDKEEFQMLMLNFLDSVSKSSFNESGSETIKRITLNNGLPRAELFITRYKER